MNLFTLKAILLVAPVESWKQIPHGCPHTRLCQNWSQCRPRFNRFECCSQCTDLWDRGSSETCPSNTFNLSIQPAMQYPLRISAVSVILPYLPTSPGVPATRWNVTSLSPSSKMEVNLCAWQGGWQTWALTATIVSRPWKAVKDPLKSRQATLCQISGSNTAPFCPLWASSKWSLW